jgi:hypothetical protein
MKVGPPATRGTLYAPGPGLSKLNSKAPSRAPHSRERGGPAVQTRCQRYFQASPIDTTFTLEGGTEPDGMSGVHRGTACGGSRSTASLERR